MFMPHQLPECVQFGAERSPWWPVDVSMTADGSESRNLNWLYARHEFDIGYGVKTREDFKAVNDHWHMARGKWRTWAMKDFLDYEVLPDEGVFVAIGGGQYQMFKRYGTGAETYMRKITRPMDGAIVLLNDVADPTFTVDYETGRVTASDSPGPSVETMTWTGGFYNHVRYDIDRLPASIVDRLNGEDYLVRVTGIRVVEVKE